MIRTKCKICSKSLGEESVTLGRIIIDCPADSKPFLQARRIISEYHLPRDTLLCDECFWMLGKKREESNLKWGKILNTILLVVSVCILLCLVLAFGWGITLIMQGYHSYDLSQDVWRLTTMLGGNVSKISECNLGGECFNLEETYRQGNAVLFNGIFLAIVSGILIPINIFAVILIARGHYGEH